MAKQPMFILLWLVAQNQCKECWDVSFTAQKIKFSIKDFFSKCDQVFHRGFLKVNVTKSAGNCRFGHIYWGNP